MNIKSIIIGSLALGLAVGGTLFVNTQDDKSVYTPRMNNGLYSHAGHAEYLHMLRADPATGLVDPTLVNEARAEVMARSKRKNKSALGLNWDQVGPDNVGGRTRAILVDKDNSNIVYAGSVTGGLFVSTDATLSWSPVAGMQGLLGDNLAISCITQTDNGRIFFGTGSTFESGIGGSGGGNGGSGAIGNGIYEYVPSTGNVIPVITNSTAVPNNASNSFWTATNAIASKGNRLYLGTRSGMLYADPDGSGQYPTAVASWFNPIWANSPTNTVKEVARVQDIDIASDGSMLVCFGGKVYTSNQTDALGSFTRTAISGSRLSGAIAPSNPNIMYVLGSSSILAGLNVTSDKGSNWDVIVPPGVSTGTPSSKDPFVQNDGTGGQGGYDDAIAVNPGDPGHVIVGGVQLYEWRQNGSSDYTLGSWMKSATLVEFDPFYVHADKHTIVWVNSSTVYVGGDGGVAKSDDAGATWRTRNLGYNVTSFYDMDKSASGFVVGGAQDNGTQLVTFGVFGGSSPLASVEIQGGDGFDCAFSNFSGGIAYATSQFGSLSRNSGGAGGTFYNNAMATIVASNTQPFHTVIENWEKANDITSIDSICIAFDSAVATIIKPAVFDSNNVVVIPAITALAGDTLFANDTIHYVSLTNSLPLTYVVPSDIILEFPIDTLKLQDPIQNRFVTRLTSTDPDDRGVYLTRDAARLNALDVKWFRISSESDIENFKFSADGKHLFMGSSGGEVYRISNLDMVNNDYSQAGWDSIVTQTLIGVGIGGAGSFGGPVVSIAVDPNDGNNIIATASGYTGSDHVYRCINALTATSSTGNFTAIQGSGSLSLPQMPVYDATIDHTDNNRVIIGTEWGVWTTDNAFSAANGAAVEWTDESGNGMTHVPVFAVDQQNLNAWESVNSGCVYLGTHGRGFYRSCDLVGIAVSVEENEFDEFGDEFVTNLNVYPNPLNNAGTLSFNLKENAETTIRIYNLTGSIVKTINLGLQTRGEHKERFDASTLSIGTYIISLESGSERNVAKFIVTR